MRALDLFARLDALQITEGELLAEMTRKRVAGGGSAQG